MTQMMTETQKQNIPFEMRKVLLIDAAMQPIAIVSLKAALTKLYSSEERKRTANGEDRDEVGDEQPRDGQQPLPRAVGSGGEPGTHQHPPQEEGEVDLEQQRQPRADVDRQRRPERAGKCELRP